MRGAATPRRLSTPAPSGPQRDSGPQAASMAAARSTPRAAATMRCGARPRCGAGAIPMVTPLCGAEPPCGAEARRMQRQPSGAETQPKARRLCGEDRIRGTQPRLFSIKPCDPRYWFLNRPLGATPGARERAAGADCHRSWHRIHFEGWRLRDGRSTGSTAAHCSSLRSRRPAHWFNGGSATNRFPCNALNFVLHLSRFAAFVQARVCGHQVFANLLQHRHGCVLSLVDRVCRG